MIFNLQWNFAYKVGVMPKESKDNNLFIKRWPKCGYFLGFKLYSTKNYYSEKKSLPSAPRLRSPETWILWGPRLFFLVKKWLDPSSIFFFSLEIMNNRYLPSVTLPKRRSPLERGRQKCHYVKKALHSERFVNFTLSRLRSVVALPPPNQNVKKVTKKNTI